MVICDVKKESKNDRSQPLNVKEINGSQKSGRAKLCSSQIVADLHVFNLL